MKKAIISAFMALAAVCMLNAQTPETSPTLKIKPTLGKEHWVSFNSGGSLGYRYKRQLNERLWWRGGLDNVGFGFGMTGSNSQTYSNLTIAYGVETGLEWRKTSDNKWTFLHGPGVGLRHNLNRYLDTGAGQAGYTNSHYLSASLHYNLGIKVSLTERLALGAEFTPGFTLSQQFSGTGSGSYTGLAFGSTAGLGRISLIFTR